MAYKRANQEIYGYPNTNIRRDGIINKKGWNLVSTHVFTYGKEILVKSAFLPGTLKTIGRVYYFEVNEIFSTCESKSATIHTSGQAAAYTILAYTIILMESYYSFARDLELPPNWNPALKNTITKIIITYHKILLPLFMNLGELSHKQYLGIRTQ